MEKDKFFVISFGGSVIVPGEINTELLKRFCFLIKNFVKKGKKFIIIAGGGKTSRKYQEAIFFASEEEKDWIGIKATELNSLLLRAFLKREADTVLLNERLKVKRFRRPVIIGSGWRPGWSTDYVAARTALDFGVKRVINLGSSDYVYNKDFEKDKLAEPMHAISWKDYLNLIPKTWKPGIHAPVDPVAARLAEKNKMEFLVASGQNLQNFKNMLLGRRFEGTVIS